ncbi:MAG: hypothetical protein AB8B99_22720 [Phormidesmis sp.]
MSNTIEQLRSIEADLATQEESLNAQLEELKQKRDGLTSVIAMFSDDSVTETPTVAPTAKAKTTKAKTTKAKTTKAKTTKAKTTKAKATKAKTTKVKATKAKTTKAKAADTAKPKAKAERKTTAAKKKTDGRAATWQKYTRPGVKNQSIPDAVKLILTTQPEKEFKIVEVMEALFNEDMPKTQYLKARNRVSNVLSGGVRAGDWYRGARSSYSMKQAS